MYITEWYPRRRKQFSVGCVCVVEVSIIITGKKHLKMRPGLVDLGMLLHFDMPCYAKASQWESQPWRKGPSTMKGRTILMRHWWGKSDAASWIPESQVKWRFLNSFMSVEKESNDFHPGRNLPTWNMNEKFLSILDFCETFHSLGNVGFLALSCRLSLLVRTRHVVLKWGNWGVVW